MLLRLKNLHVAILWMRKISVKINFNNYHLKGDISYKKVYAWPKKSSRSKGAEELDIKFRTRLLEKCYREHKEAAKKFGDQVARKYIQRIDIIKKTQDLVELKKLPSLRCHALTGDRQGQYAIKLTGFGRLIFTLEGEQLEIVCIEEVSKHYDD